jgi:hypothetical protein
MIKSILFSALVSIMVVVIAILIVIPAIQLQPLQNRQALAQNMTLANKSGNLSGLMMALNTVGGNSSNNNISPTLHGEQQQSPLSITQSMRAGVQSEQHLAITKTSPRPHTAAIAPSAKLNGTYYIFSKSRAELMTPRNNTHTGEFGNGIKIALIVPTFTQAAYNNAFYKFYGKYANVPYGKNVTTDLNLLSSKVLPIDVTSSSRSAFAMLQLVSNLKWITQQSNITILTDADVDNGSIFINNTSSSNNNAYDVIILGHQEYVTQKEYDNLRKFVTNGGTMIILDGNVFFAEVKYDRSNQTVTLVKGHWWAFNGKSAWKSVNERWAKETSTWVGSNYLCYRCVNKFTNDPFGYTPHEEQYVTNPHDIILLNYDASLSRSIMSRSKPVIASYELSYQKGRTIALGIYSEDIISNGRFDRYLDSLLLQYDIKISD